MDKDPLELPKDVVTLQEFACRFIEAVRELPEEQKAEMRRRLYAYLLPQKNSSPTDPQKHLHHRTARRHNTAKYQRYLLSSRSRLADIAVTIPRRRWFH